MPLRLRAPTVPAPNGTALQTLGRKFAYFNNYEPMQSIGLYPTDGTTEDFAYGELGLAAAKLRDGRGQRAVEDAQAHRRVLEPEAAHRLGHQRDARRRRDAEGDLAGHVAAHLADLLPRLADLLGDQARAPVERAAELGGRRATRAAHQELDRELLLQAAQRLGERGLRELELACRGVNAAGLDDRHEALHGVELHDPMITARN